MCGICGIAYTDPRRSVDPNDLIKMRDSLAHRGPDGSGVHLERNVGLGHRRLSIIDLEGGAQPLSNEDGTVWVTFNGEIYNYQSLRRRLTDRGHVFRTLTDTEVLVHAYEEFGLDFPTQLNGIAALALYDIRRNRLILVRDHLGVKPLFYTVTPEGLFFASEIKAILSVAGLTPATDGDVLQEYMMFRYVAWDRSFFSGVKRLPPGHLAVWEDGHLTMHRFYDPGSFSIAADPGEDEAADEMEGLLSDAVARQLMSDVPLGSFCSGGVDSGLVTGFATQHSPSGMHTFSVAFEDPAWDETPLARDTASRFGTHHHTMVYTREDFERLLPQLIWFNDEPLSHPNSIPIYLLSKLARESVTVVLTGEGADELFCGYPRYHIARLASVTSRLPDALSPLASSVLRGLPGHRAKLAARLLDVPFKDSLVLNSSYVPPRLVSTLTGKNSDALLRHRRAIADGCVLKGDAVASLSRYELQTYLVCALDRMDRMSMAVGLEGRVPFLDLPLVNWGLQLPSALKLRGPRTKRVVKLLARRYLSPDVIRGPKSGFGLPLSTWFRSEALEPLLARLRDGTHPAAKHFDQRSVATVVASHLRGDADYSEALWLLANVYVWHEVHGVG